MKNLFCCLIMLSLFTSRVVVLVLTEEFPVVGLILLFDDKKQEN